MASSSGDECRTVDAMDSLDGLGPSLPIDFRPTERDLGEGTLSKSVSGVSATRRDVDRTLLIFVGVVTCLALV